MGLAGGRGEEDRVPQKTAKVGMESATFRFQDRGLQCDHPRPQVSRGRSVVVSANIPHCHRLSRMDPGRARLARLIMRRRHPAREDLQHACGRRGATTFEQWQWRAAPLASAHCQPRGRGQAVPRGRTQTVDQTAKGSEALRVIPTILACTHFAFISPCTCACATVVRYYARPWLSSTLRPCPFQVCPCPFAPRVPS